MWSAAFDPSVLRVIATPCEAAAPVALDLDRNPARVEPGTDCQHLLIALDGPAIRLDVVAGTVLAGPVTLEPVIALGNAFDAQIEAGRRLDALVRGAPLPTVADPRVKRLVLALRILDARRAGVSLRELASGLWGSEWPGAGDCVKSRVRRLVATAERMRHAGPRGVFDHTL